MTSFPHFLNLVPTPSLSLSLSLSLSSSSAHSRSVHVPCVDLSPSLSISIGPPNTFPLVAVPTAQSQVASEMEVPAARPSHNSIHAPLPALLATSRRTPLQLLDSRPTPSIIGHLKAHCSPTGHSSLPPQQQWVRLRHCRKHIGAGQVVDVPPRLVQGP